MESACRRPIFEGDCRMACSLGSWLFHLGILLWIGNAAGVEAFAPNSGLPGIISATPQQPSNAQPMHWDGFWQWYDQRVSRTNGKGGISVAKTEKPAAKREKLGAKAAKSDAKHDKPVAKTSDESASSTTYTVKKGPLRVTVDLEGVFQAQAAREIIVKPEEWTNLTVESAVPHGVVVRQGDVLLSLETEKLDRAIAELRNDLNLSENAMRQSEEQVAAMEKIVPLDLEASQRSVRTAQEDQKFFSDLLRSFAMKAADFSLKVAREHLEYEEEELHQLEKMYKANDITEETEQIVLKRARDTVERAKFMVEYTKLGREEVVKFSVPRMGEQVNEMAQRRMLDWEKNKVELPLALQKQRLELKKLHVQWERTDEKLRKMLGDRELMTVKSPIDGTVYYGKCVKGKFSDSSSMAENLRHNGSIQSNQVVMTVVQTRPMFIQATASEDELHRLRPGLKGIATPTGYPDLRLPTTVDRVADIPTSPGNFDVRLGVALDRQAKWLMPGMTCKVKLIAYLKKDAVSVPLKAVGADELDDQKHFVYVQAKDGKPKKQAVTLGEKTEKQAEILKGLAVGDKILGEAPKDEK
jgi:multidrug resistance efflux pump